MGEALQRVELLLGGECMQRLREARVVVFGVGGVGGWCAEALVRSGIGHITIVDKDCVAVSNINRQVMALHSTIGRAKVEVLRERLLDINPELDVVARHEWYTAATADSFVLSDYDYVVDAIDSVPDKVLLIVNACKSKARLLSSMGAALKSDPTRIRVAEFWKVKGCPLARALRNHFKRSGVYPARKFRCVYSDELLKNAPTLATCENESVHGANGTLMHATAIFGLTLAHLIINEVHLKDLNDL